MDIALLATIGLIVLGTVVSAFLGGRSRDRCLRSFRGFMVTIVVEDGKRVWGHLALEASGLELEYAREYLDGDHLETSYMLSKDEFSRVRLFLRFHGDLTEENKRRRVREVKTAYHPWPLRLFARKVRNVVNTCKDSIFEVLGLVMSRAKTLNPALASAGSQEKRATGIAREVVGAAGRAYDPLLERHIGRRVVLEITTDEGKVEEHVGIFKDYSPRFVQVMDVSFPDADGERLCDVIVPRSHASIRHGAEADA